MIDSARIATAGSVDDGKSTLLGRLLVDSKALFDDHTATINRLGKSRGLIGADLAAVTDGLKAEREQGITIDVAYRYFATPKRRFVLLDTPGHEQYTRNMVTGAANADASIVLVDASQGLKPQTHRHTLIAHVLGHQHVIFAINKMDLVDYQEARFIALSDDCEQLARRVGIPAPYCIPLSALTGEGVVASSSTMPWYRGPTLLQQLETLPVDRATAALSRLPIQWVNRYTDPAHGQLRRGLTGTLSGGTLTHGERVRLYPDAHEARIDRLWSSGQEVQRASAGSDVHIELDRDLDAYRGQIVVPATACQPRLSSVLHGTVNWFSPHPARVGQTVIVQQGGFQSKGCIDSLDSRLDPATAAHTSRPRQLEMNDIGTMTLVTADAFVQDAFSQSRTTGSVVCIDPYSFETLGVLLFDQPSERPNRSKPL